MSPSTTDATAPESGRVWTITNAVLAVLAVIALVCLVLVLVRGVRVIPGTSHAEKGAARYDAVVDATRTQTADFLTVDYKRMPEIQKKVLSEITGKLKSEYTATKGSVTTSAKAAKATVRPTIRDVAISKLSGDSATVFVAADLVRKNTGTAKAKASKTCPHAGADCLYLRLRVSLSDTAGGWRVSNLEATP